MPMVEVKIGKGGKMETDYIGFPNNSCNEAEGEIMERLKRLKMNTISEEPKDDELLQEEKQVE